MARPKRQTPAFVDVSLPARFDGREALACTNSNRRSEALQRSDLRFWRAVGRPV